MTEDNVIPLNSKKSEPDNIYDRIYGCLEAAYLQVDHNCSYCRQNSLIAKMMFEIIMSELISIGKKTKLNFTTFDVKIILNKISERILSLEQEMVSKQETGVSRETKFGTFEGRDTESAETSESAKKIDRETPEISTSDGEDKE